MDKVVMLPLGAKASGEERLREALGRADRQASTLEYGDFLFSLVNVARYLKIHPEDALRQVNDKFQRRFQHVERRLAEQGIELASAGLERMDRLWNEAKAGETGPA